MGLLLDELHRGLEEIVPEAQQVVDGVESSRRLFSFQTVIADEATDDRPVFLFNVGLVVFLVRGAAGVRS